MLRSFAIQVLGVLLLIMSVTDAIAIPDRDQQHTVVVLRSIAHELLLSSGDSTSLVLPVQEVMGRYLIQFDTELTINPNDLSILVDSVMQRTQLASSYIVTVEKCDTVEVVYTYEVGYRDTLDIIPCKGRALPKACYNLWIDLGDEPEKEAVVAVASTSDSGPNWPVIGLLVLLVGAIGWVIGKLTIKKADNVQADLIQIGNYKLCKNTLKLSLNDEQVELTHKEADLLMLLYNYMNQTLAKEEILRQVWGDEGDYVGRTLDVFISKLRKKLEADPNVKIVNARGVGYRLVVGE